MAAEKNPRYTVLVVEDDPDIQQVITFALTKEGYQVRMSDDGASGWREIEEEPPDLVVLDVMLPEMDGIEVCKRIRANNRTRHIAVVMVTAKNQDDDQITGFEAGADDYVGKPFNVKILLKRVRVLLDRMQTTSTGGEDLLEAHGIRMDRVAHEVYIDGTKVSLTPTEFRILETLLKQPGRAFTRAQILEHAVGDTTIVLERTIDVHIRSLRAKLEEIAPGKEDVIETVRGVGYRMARPDGAS